MPLGNVALHLVETPEEANDFLRWLGESRSFLACDTETTGVNLVRDRIRLVQFGDLETAWAIPYENWRGLVETVFDRYDRPMVFHNAKFDLGMLRWDGIKSAGRDFRKVHDTVMMLFLADSQGPKGLKVAAQLYVDRNATDNSKDLRKKMTLSKGKIGWHNIPVTAPEYWHYAALDTVLTAHLAETLYPVAQRFSVAYDLEMATSRVLMNMEGNGTPVDTPYCEMMLESERLRNKTARAELAEYGINPNVVKTIVSAFRDQGIPFTPRVSRTGKVSIDDDVLELTGHPLATKIQEARNAARNVKTYFEKFIEHSDAGVLHPEINQLKARSGRMSMTSPAVHQAEKSSLIRDAFIASEGNKLLMVDYSNEEMRLAASLCAEENMQKAFAEGADLHRGTAAIAYGISESEVQKNQRQCSKRALFTKIYGGGTTRFGDYLGITPKEAEDLFAAVTAKYPQIDVHMAHLIQQVKNTAEGGFGYITLRDGRRLKVPADKAYSSMAYSCQGEGAVVIKRAVVNLDAAGLGELMKFPVHDEVVFDVPESDVEEVRRIAIETMTNHDYEVELEVEATIADRWGDPYRGVEKDKRTITAAQFQAQRQKKGYVSRGG